MSAGISGKYNTVGIWLSSETHRADSDPIEVLNNTLKVTSSRWGGLRDHD